jgi:hypothetical protein
VVAGDGDEIYLLLIQGEGGGVGKDKGEVEPAVCQIMVLPVGTRSIKTVLLGSWG